MGFEYAPFKISDVRPAIDGFTISTKPLFSTSALINYFSLGAGTDVSPEYYPESRLYIANWGNGLFQVDGKKLRTLENDILLVPKNSLCGVASENGFVYTEVVLREEVNMNKVIKPGVVLDLAKLVPYQTGSIVNLDVVSSPSMKFVVMAFDAGTSLSPHKAPGDALLFALDGEATIGYEGAEFPIKSGEQFHFAKGGLHSVQTSGRFKMALLLVLD